MQIKVLHIIIGLNSGGAELMLKRLISHTTLAKHEVVSLTSLGVVGLKLRNNNINVIHLGLNKFNIFFVFLKLFLILRKNKPDIVQTWMVHSDLLGGFSARIAGINSVVWGVRTTDYSVESRSTRFVRWLCARLSGVVPARIVCAAQASLLNSQVAGYAADKLMVIPNGFDVAELSASLGAGQDIRRILAIESSTCLVGCMGRFNPAKDHANFVAAAGVLARRFPQVRFLMVGRGLDANNPELMEQIEATGFPERFVLLGERADPAACLDAMDVFVLSSCTEGFPNVLGEAMVMGLPCVSTDVGDAALLMGSKQWLVPARDSMALADRLTELLSLPEEERLQLGRQARQRVVEAFSMTATAQQFMNLYTSLVNVNP